MMVVAGDYSLSIYEGTEQEILPQLLVPHPQYNNTTNNNDIMLIKVRRDDTSARPWPRPLTPPPCLQLKAPVYLNSYVSIALLPRQAASIAAGRMCRVSGWGYTSPGAGEIPSTLRTVTLPIVSTRACNGSASFNGSITDNMLCAGYSAGGKDACKVRADRGTGLVKLGLGEAVEDIPESGSVSGGLWRSAGVRGAGLRPGVLGQRLRRPPVPWGVHGRVPVPPVDRRHHLQLLQRLQPGLRGDAGSCAIAAS